MQEDSPKPALKSQCVLGQTRLQSMGLSQNKECNGRRQQALRHSILLFSFFSISTNPLHCLIARPDTEVLDYMPYRLERWLSC